jgi:hypothetical protein
MKNVVAVLVLVAFAQDKPPATTKEAMKPIQFLVGEWKATWTPEGKDAKEGWEELQAWEYKIEKDDYALQFTVKDGKRFKDGVLGYDLKKKVYRLDVTRADDKKAKFEGKLEGKDLILDEVADEKAAHERVTFNFLRDNRFIGDMQRREAGAKSWNQTAAIQFTKQGVPFVRSEAPKCIVTGGSGTIEVAYQGKTYYVC